MSKMRPNLVDAGFVIRAVRRHDNFATIFEQSEVMGGQVVRETHHVLASLHDTILPRALIGFRRLLGDDTCRQDTQSKCQKYGPHAANPSNERDRLNFSSPGGGSLIVSFRGSRREVGSRGPRHSFGRAGCHMTGIPWVRVGGRRGSARSHWREDVLVMRNHW